MSNPEFTAPNYTTDTASTYKANIDASIAANGADCVNIGCSYDVSSGVFTIHDAVGGTLSTANPGFVRFQNKTTPGQLIYISVEANQSFIDDNGSSEIINNLFGLTTGRAAAVDIPFYIYAVCNNDQDAVAFMLSRVPGKPLSPAAASIGAPDDAVADTQASFFSLENIDESVYDENPAVCLGCIRMRMSASDDWTVQTMSTKDGIGRFHEDTLFTSPTGHFGADAGVYTSDNGGTAPAFTTNTMTYTINRAGNFHIECRQYGDAGTDGAGAVYCEVAIPFLAKDYIASQLIPNGVALVNEATNGGYVAYPLIYASVSDSLLVFVNATNTLLTWALFTNGGRNLNFSFQSTVA